MAFSAPPALTALGIHTFMPKLHGHRRPSFTSVQPALKMMLGKNVRESLEANPAYKTFLQLVDTGGVDLNFSSCMVFAPGNRAFMQLRDGLVKELLLDAKAAREIILRHIVPGKVQTSKQIEGSGFYEGVFGGPLSYEAIGSIVKIGSQRLVIGYENDECSNGIIHMLGGVILDAPTYKPAGLAQYYQPNIPKMNECDSTIATVYPSARLGYLDRMALGAASKPSTVGGRKAMGLMRQLPFWQYGPPFNAAKQEDFEPISIVQENISSNVDFQVMPPGTVVVDPKEVNAAKLLPVSGMSKYIGSSKRMVEGDGLSNYSRLDD